MNGFWGEAISPHTFISLSIHLSNFVYQAVGWTKGSQQTQIILANGKSTNGVWKLRETAMALENLACPTCKQRLTAVQMDLFCNKCKKTFSKNEWGYYDLFNLIGTYLATDFAVSQFQKNDRRYTQYLSTRYPLSEYQKVLDVGCGLGYLTHSFTRNGYDAYGVDIASTARHWEMAGRNPENYFCCDACELPFPDNCFDLVCSFGVIEHIGTVTGHCTLLNNYNEFRRNFASELLRVTTPGGKIIVSCPNKIFPIDIQHGALDSASDHNLLKKLRHKLFEKTCVHIHPIWGHNHLLSHKEIRELFIDKASKIKALSNSGFFGFSQFKNNYLKPFAKVADYYVSNLPVSLRETVFNPYVIVEITKRT